MKSGGSYLSHNQFRSQIGLGTAKKVDQIIVNWQHGVEDVIEDVQANKHLTIREEDGIILVEQ